MGESANGRCSVKKVFLFATSPCSGYWLTCLTRKRYSQRRLLCFPDYFTRDKNGRNSFSKEFSCSCAMNKFRTGLVLFAEYSIIRQSTSRYGSTIASYLLRIEKKSVIFSGSKQIPQRNTMLSQENM